MALPATQGVAYSNRYPKAPKYNNGNGDRRYAALVLMPIIESG